MWKPIDTCPMDGTTVLLSRGSRVTGGEWMVEKWPSGAEYHASTGEYLGQYETGECIEAHWFSWDGGFTESEPPTHWMPLPEPPQ